MKDIMVRLLVGGGCVDSAACSTVVLERRRNRRGGGGERARRGGWTRKVQGISRRREKARGGLEGPRRRRGVHGWLGGFPPSSLGARDREEDPSAPGGPAWLAGPLSPGRQVSVLCLF